jgi:hypothetical protein
LENSAPDGQERFYTGIVEKTVNFYKQAEQVEHSYLSDKPDGDVMAKMLTSIFVLAT